MPNKTLVPDKLQGYLLQVKHMLFELISVDDRIVSIEKLDDVAVEADGTVIAEQVKSVTSANNPIAERSSVFWKTLYNWCTYIEAGALPSGAGLSPILCKHCWAVQNRAKIFQGGSGASCCRLAYKITAV